MADLMFFTPMLPFPTGHGSSMRASVALEVLSEKHRVFVIHSRIWPWRGVFDEHWVRDRAAGYTTLSVQPDTATLEQLGPERISGSAFHCRVCVSSGHGAGRLAFLRDSRQSSSFDGSGSGR